MGSVPIYTCMYVTCRTVPCRAASCLTILNHDGSTAEDTRGRIYARTCMDIHLCVLRNLWLLHVLDISRSLYDRNAKEGGSIPGRRHRKVQMFSRPWAFQKLTPYTSLPLPCPLPLVRQAEPYSSEEEARRADQTEKSLMMK